MFNEKLEVMTIEKEIRSIAERLAKRVNSWIDEGQDLKDRFNSFLDIELSYVSFESNNVKASYRVAVLITMSLNHATHYRIIYPKINY